VSSRQTRLVPLLTKDDFAAFAPEIERLMRNPVWAEATLF